MARLYADENFPLPVVERLRRSGHDVLTCREDGRDNQRIDDPDVLARAHELGRIVLTVNRSDFRRLHRRGAVHSGIVACSDDPDHPAQASRVEAAIARQGEFDGQLVCVYRTA